MVPEDLISLERSLARTVSIEFMPYHRLGSGKLEGLGMEPRMPSNSPGADAGQLDRWLEALSAAGISASVS
jgi:hypothetical protein